MRDLCESEPVLCNVNGKFESVGIAIAQNEYVAVNELYLNESYEIWTSISS